MSTSPDNLNPADQASPRWYCLRSNQTIGPMSTDELVDLIHRRMLADYDLVRLDGTDEWQKVAEIRQLLMEPASDSEEQAPVSRESSPTESLPDEPCVAGKDGTSASTLGDDVPPPSVKSPVPQQPEDDSHDAAHAASDALNHMNVARLHRAASGEARKRRPARTGKPIFATAIDMLSAMLTWLIVLIGRSLKLRSVQAVLGIGLMAGVIWGVVLPRWPIDSRKLLTEYTDLSKRIEAQRESDTSAYKWQQLEEDVTAAVGDARPRLTREASSQRPDLQELLAAAEVLPVAVSEGQSADDDKRLAASKLVIHLKNAERHIARRAELNANPVQSGGSFSTGDGMFWIIVFVDILLAAALLIWGMRLVLRRGSQETPTAT